MTAVDEIKKLHELVESGAISRAEFEKSKERLLAGGSARPANVSPHEFTTVCLLSFFLGYLGVHRFVVGKTGTGVLQMLTCGGCGIWSLIDFIVVATGNFKDAQGRVIKSRSSH